MRFNLKFFQLTLLICCSLPVYSASSAADDVIAIMDGAVAPKITVTQAINDTSFRSDFFKTFDDEKNVLLKSLISDAIQKNDLGIRVKDFLEEAVIRGFFSKESITPYLMSENTSLGDKKRSLAQQLIKTLDVASRTTEYTLTQHPELSAFSTPGALKIEATDALPERVRVSPTICTLTQSEQIYLLHVRASLGTIKLPEALSKFDEILNLTQQIAITKKTKENIKQAADLVGLAGKLHAITPVIANYLKSAKEQHEAIVPSTEKVLPGYIWNSSVKEFSAEQLLQRVALQTRQELAFSVFDAFFGLAIKPDKVPTAIDFRLDISPENQLASAVFVLHAIVSPAIATRAFEINSNGTINDEALNEATTAIMKETTNFLKLVWGAKVAAKTKAITEFVAPIEEHKE